MQIWTREQLYADGVGHREIKARLARKELVQLRPGMFADGAAYDMLTDAGRHALLVAAAQKRIRRATVASGASWLILHGVSVLSPMHVVTLTATRGHPKQYDGLVVQVAELPRHHVMNGLDVPSTVVARGVLDVARLGSQAEGLVAADSALHVMACSKEELLAMSLECREWPGGIQAERVCNLSNGQAESAGESLSRIMFLEHGIPMPELQQWITTGTDPPDYRVDFLWRDKRVIGEFDGQGKYDDPLEKVREKAREERLRAAGYIVVRWTWDDVMTDPDAVVARILAAFAQAAA